jgi:hypothetical protein
MHRHVSGRKTTSATGGRITAGPTRRWNTANPARQTAPPRSETVGAETLEWRGGPREPAVEDAGRCTRSRRAGSHGDGPLRRSPGPCAARVLLNAHTSTSPSNICLIRSEKHGRGLPKSAPPEKTRNPAISTLFWSSPSARCRQLFRSASRTVSGNSLRMRRQMVGFLSRNIHPPIPFHYWQARTFAINPATPQRRCWPSHSSGCRSRSPARAALPSDGSCLPPRCVLLIPSLRHGNRTVFAPAMLPASCRSHPGHARIRHLPQRSAPARHEPLRVRPATPPPPVVWLHALRCPATDQAPNSSPVTQRESPPSRGALPRPAGQPHL